MLYFSIKYPDDSGTSQILLTVANERQVAILQHLYTDTQVLGNTVTYTLGNKGESENNTTISLDKGDCIIT